MLKDILKTLQIAIFLLVSLSCLFIDSNLKANSTDPTTDLINLGTEMRKGFATAPQCDMPLSALIALVGAATAYMAMFIEGINMIYTAMMDPTAITLRWLLIKGTIMAISATGMTMGILYGHTPFICYFFFVRNPVAHYDAAISPSNPDYPHRTKMKKRISPYNALTVRYTPTNNHWEAEYAPYSPYMYIGFRYPYLLNLGVGVGCENGTHALSTDKNTYRGETSRMCPEEWNNLGIDFTLDDSAKPGFPVMKVGSSADGSDFKYWNKSKYNSFLHFMKNNSAPVYLRGPFTNNQIINISGYNVKIQYGNEGNNSTCAYLLGFGALNLSNALFLGCHKKFPKSIFPKCHYSVPIYSDGDWDNELQTIIPGTPANPQGQIIGYDDSQCYSCVISGACVGNGDMRPHMAPLPFTSMAYRCIKESLAYFIHGCIGQAGQTIIKGNIAVIQERMAKTSLALVALGVLTFVTSLLSSGGAIQKEQLFSLIIKLSIISWLTMPNNLGIYGLQTAFGWAQNITEGFIASVVTAAAGQSGLCEYNPSDLILTYKGVTTDYSYLAIWNYYDCYVSYMLGFPLLPQSLIASASDTVDLGVPYVFGLLLLLTACILGGPFMILVVLGALMVAIILLILVVWVTQMVIMSTVMLTILGLFGPVFAPMLVVPILRPLFDSWMKETIAYLLAQVVMSIFMLFIMRTVHTLYFGNTMFIGHKAYLLGVPRTIFFVAQGAASGSCPSSSVDFKQGEIPCGCDNNSTACWLSGYKFETKSVGLGLKLTGATQVTTAAKDNTNFAIDMLTLAAVLFLFVHSLPIIQSMIMELSGARGMGNLAKAAINPQKSIKGVANKFVGAGTASIDKVRNAVSDKKDKNGSDGDKDKKSGGGSGGQSTRARGGISDSVSTGTKKV